jgi:DNA-binding transcriptional LysR family regulator
MHALQPRILKIVEEVVRTGSMRKAAGRLNVSPSSLNRQILALEQELGAPLFERFPRNLRLTASGELVIAFARRSAREAQRLEAQLEDLKGLRRGEVTLATMAGLASDFLTALAIEFQDRHPRVRLAFHRNSLDEIMSAVISGEVDLGLAFGVRRDPNIRVILSIEARLGLVVSPSHPLASRSVVKLTDCVLHPLILPGQSMVFRGILDEAFAKMAISVDPLIETTEFEMMKRFVMLNRGVAFLNRINIDIEQRRGELRFIPIQEGHLLSQQLTLFCRERGALSTLASLFAESTRLALLEIGSQNL